MTAPIGSPAFSTKKSIKLDSLLKQTVKEVVQDLKNENSWQEKLEWKSKLDFSKIYPSNLYALKDSGKPCETIPDGGFVFYEQKCILMSEAKFKQKKGNADERVHGLLDDADALGIKRKNQLIVFGGSCVEQNNKGYLGSTATRKVVERLHFKGVTFLFNPSKENLYNTIKKLILDEIEQILKQK